MPNPGRAGGPVGMARQGVNGSPGQNRVTFFALVQDWSYEPIHTRRLGVKQA